MLFGGDFLMFKDAKEELKRIEAELLAEEEVQPEELEPQEELSATQILEEELLNSFLEETQKIDNVEEYQNYSNRYGAGLDDRTRVFQIYNTDKSDPDLQQYADAVREEPKKEKLTGLIVTAALLTAGILGVLIWWLLRFGVLG